MEVKICTFNVRGLGDQKKRRQIFKWVRDNEIGICLLQETHSTKNIESYWKAEWGYEIILSGDSSNSCGVGFLINNTFSKNNITSYEIIPGRALAIKLEIEQTELTIVNIYGPNRDDTSIFYKIQEFMENNETDNFIIGGDFNVILNPTLDKKNGIPNRNIQCRRLIKAVIEKYELEDIWRSLHPDIEQYTWESSHNPPIKCRLDYFLISSRIKNIINTTNIITGIKSDHCPVTLNIEINKQKRGPGLFKLNNSLLLDENYKQLIRSNIQSVVEINQACNPNILWDVIKGTIRNETIRYASNKKRENIKQEKQLQETLNILTANLSRDPNNENIKEEIKKKKTELETLYDKKN